jgi:hypothetical protein
VRTKIRLGVAVVAAGMSTLTIAMPPAYADTGSVTIQGAGTISPGLTTTPTTQFFSFSASGPIVDAGHPLLSGTYSCNINGQSSTPEAILAGSGTFNGSCSGPTTVSLSGVYSRDGGYASWVLAGQIDGPITASFTGACTTVPTSAPTIASYRVACTLAFN